MNTNQPRTVNHMAENDPLKDLPNVPDVLEEAVTLSADPQKFIAKKTTNAYLHAALATAVTVPLVTGGGVPSISNVPVRKPDENIPANQSQQPTAEPMRTQMVAAASANALSLDAYSVVHVDDRGTIAYKVEKKKNETP